ncbi:MAG: hypothetical protein WCO57_04645 [Verrucomicrobiota bacterium]
MKTILAAIACALFASCATQRPAPVNYTAPAKAAPVAPAVSSVRANQSATYAVSSKLQTQVAVLSDKTATLQASLQAATATADKLRKAKTATEAELELQWEQLSAITASHLALEEGMKQAKATVAELQTTNANQARSIDALADAVDAAESERDALRAQRDDMAKTIGTQQKLNDTMQAKVDKAEKAAAVGSYLKWAIGISAFVIFIAACGLVYLKFLTPRIPIP